MAATELDQKIQEVYKHIATERKILEGIQLMRQATTNQDVLRRNEAKFRESERSLSYFQDTLRELQARKLQLSHQDRQQGSPSPKVPSKDHDPSNRGRPNDPAGQVFSGVRSPQFGPPKPKQYTKLDLIKADTPITPAKISKMLHQLEFKLQVELQYKKGIDKMAKLYQADGDKKSRADAESKKVESEKKIQLLQTALKRYKNLHILDDLVDDDETDGPAGSDGERKENIRSKPLSGILQVTVQGARELDHAPIPSFGRIRSSSKQSSETFVSLKVEGTQLAKSHPSRTDRWNEDFEITVDKANEVEIVVSDKQAGDSNGVPIGLLWIRIHDLVEALRRQKVGLESGQGGWVTAGAMHGDGPQGHGHPGHGHPLSGDFNAPLGGGFSGTSLGGPTSIGPATADGIDAWFSVEPAGAIALRLNFIKENVRKRPLDAPLGGLGRQGAVRKRKGEVHVMNGHKFVQQQFYQIMLRADKPSRPAGRPQHDHLATSASIDAQMDRIKLSVPEPVIPSLPSQSDSYSRMSPAPSQERYQYQQAAQQPFSPPGQSSQLPPQQIQTPTYIPPSPSNVRPSRVPIPPGPGYPPDGRLQGLYEQGPPAGYDGYPQQPGHPAPRPQVQVPPVQPKQPGIGSPVQIPRPIDRVSLPASPKRPPQEVAAIRPQASQQHLAPQVLAQQQPQQQPPARPPRKVTLNDFNFLAVLGKGNFGKVMLAEEKTTNGLYAIKVLKKEFIIDNDEVESTRSEKRVFLAAARERHPFLLGLHSCFQTETRIYFVMEYVSGGDLMLHIQRKQFSLRQAKFYASEVLLALEYFHANGIIYRDLKLDNILLTLDGHVKVADYGLCKEEMWYGNTTSTFCGTPEFMAPEILLEQRYGRAVDWWAFGVLTYEMLLGQSPFRGDDEDEIFDAILEDEPLYPITMPRDAVSILQKLLTRDPSRRLGSTKEDAEEIKRQPFFKDVNFDDVLHKRIPPPYFPTIKGSADTSNFDEEFTREKPTLTPVHGQLSSRDQAEFNGFSWVAQWADV
ncbi:hypothetical protein C0993_000220 [Termitomyces sp. T159_Od127]|nr:hypothetical protein C0993_000220 [Termitomyces sp. T159_Od127]